MEYPYTKQVENTWIVNNTLFQGIPHPFEPVLYWITEYENNLPDEIYFGVMRTDMDLNVEALQGVRHNPTNSNAAISTDGSLLYFFSGSSPSFFEFNLPDLSVEGFTL